MKCTCVIFDLDGTLLNTLEDLLTSVNFALSEFGLPARTLDEMRSFVGNGNPYMIRCAVPEGTAAETEAAVLDAFYAHYRLHYNEKTRPYAGIREMLETLRAAGIKTAVCSNKFHEATQALIDDLLPGLIDATLGTVPEVPRKPAADMPEKLLSLLGEAKENALYVGDSDVDVATARNAGIGMPAVSWGFRSVEQLKKAGASVILDTPEEVTAYILERR